MHMSINDNSGTMVKISKIVDLHDKRENDWKQNYVGVEGRLFLEISHTHPQKYYAHFFPDKPNKEAGVKDWLTTSIGEYESLEGCYILRTNNSIFYFEDVMKEKGTKNV